jgi:hypothetical protein
MRHRADHESAANQGAVLTLFFLGTREHHLKNLREEQTQREDADAAGETNPLLLKLKEHIDTQNNNNQFTHLIDGAGGYPEGDEAESNPMLGNYKVECSFEAKTGELIVNKTILTSSSAAIRIQHLKGCAVGTGIKDGIQEAKLVVDTLVEAGKIPLVINAFGYSRGADAITRFANVLQGYYVREIIRINAFQVDPVAGTTRRKAAKAQLVPDNIQNLHVILMEDENKPGFEPQCKRRRRIQDSKYTTVVYQIHRGKHNTSLRMDSKEEKLGTAALVWDEAERFAREHGTQLSDRYLPANLTEEQRLKAYTHVLIDEKAYLQLRKATLRPRDCALYKEDYFLHGRNYFQNKEHVELFAKRYPAFFDFYFQQARNRTTFDAAQQTLNSMDPDLRQSLIAKNIWNSTTPQGIYLTPEEYDRLSPLFDRALSIVNETLTGNNNEDKMTIGMAVANAKKWRVKLINIMENNMDVPHKEHCIKLTIMKEIQRYKNQSECRPLLVKLIGLMGDDLPIYDPKAIAIPNYLTKAQLHSEDTFDRVATLRGELRGLQELAEEKAEATLYDCAMSIVREVLAGTYSEMKMTVGEEEQWQRWGEYLTEIMHHTHVDLTDEYIKSSIMEQLNRYRHKHNFQPLSLKLNALIGDDFLAPSVSMLSAEARPNNPFDLARAANSIQITLLQISISHPTRALLLIEELKSYLKTPRIFHDTALAAKKNRLVEIALHRLEVMHNEGLGNDPEALTPIINQLLRISSRLRISKGQEEGALDKLLRKHSLAVASMTPVHRPPEPTHAVSMAISNFDRAIAQEFSLASGLIFDLKNLLARKRTTLTSMFSSSGSESKSTTSISNEMLRFLTELELRNQGNSLTSIESFIETYKSQVREPAIVEVLEKYSYEISITRLLTAKAGTTAEPKRAPSLSNNRL